MCLFWIITNISLKGSTVGVPFSLVGRAGVPCAEALSLLRRPGFDSWPTSLCCLSLPLSQPVSYQSLQLPYQEGAKKNFKQEKKKKKAALSAAPGYLSHWLLRSDSKSYDVIS